MIVTVTKTLRRYNLEQPDLTRIGMSANHWFKMKYSEDTRTREPEHRGDINFHVWGYPVCAEKDILRIARRYCGRRGIAFVKEKRKRTKIKNDEKQNSTHNPLH